MSINTVGYSRLNTLVSNLIGAASELDQKIYSRWRERRYETIERQLSEICATPSVRSFFDDYANDLADQLASVLTEGPLPEEPAQTAIDYVEGLFVQTQRCALVEPVPQPEAANPQMAMAA
jgi:hypothetical protein